MRTLLFDADHDPTTHLVCRFREVELDSILHGAFISKALRGPLATRESLYPLLNSRGFQVLTGSGHGTGDTFQGQNRRLVFSVGGVNPGWVAGMVVHLLSCDCGQSLGQYLVHQGCVAFFGYRTPFVFNDFTANALLDCDTEILRGLASQAPLPVIERQVRGKFEQLARDYNARGGEYRRNVHLIEMMGKGFCMITRQVPV